MLTRQRVLEVTLLLLVAASSPMMAGARRSTPLSLSRAPAARDRVKREVRSAALPAVAKGLQRRGKPFPIRVNSSRNLLED